MLCQQGRWIALVAIQVATLFVTCGAMEAGTPLVTPCDGMVDIVFVLSSSFSMQQQMGPQTVRNFTADVSTHFTLGPDNVRVGLATLSDTISPVFNLNTYSNNANLAAALRTEQSSTSSTGTSVSISEATQMFSTEVGGRANARKVIIILSDVDRVYTDARQNKELGYRIITVPISEFELPNLVKLASGPNDVLSVNDVQALPNIQDKLIQLLCPTPGETINKFSSRADIIFVLDASQDALENSLSKLSYDHVLNFAVAITERFSLGEAAARFGAVVFSTTPSKVFNLNSHSNHTTLAAAIRATPYLDGISNISKAFSFITQARMFDSINGGRNNATKFVVFVTYPGIITKLDEESIASFKRKGVHVLLIGVGFPTERAIKCTRSLHKDTFYGGGFYTLEYLQAPVANKISVESKNDLRCAVTAKLYFIIESSNKITTAEFTAALAFAAELARQFKLGPQNALIFAQTFGSSVNTLFELGELTDEPTMTQAFTTASYINGSADFSKALEYIDFQGDRGLGADPFKYYIVVLSNGRPDFPKSYSRSSMYQSLTLLKLWPATFVTFGIGENPNGVNLEEWASRNYYYEEANTTAIDAFLGHFPDCMRTD